MTYKKWLTILTGLLICGNVLWNLFRKYGQLSRDERLNVRGCIQKFPAWPPGARNANGTALCYKVHLYRCFVSQSTKFYRHSPLCCFSTSVYCCKHIFHYGLSPETFGYTVV